MVTNPKLYYYYHYWFNTNSNKPDELKTERSIAKFNHLNATELCIFISFFCIFFSAVNLKPADSNSTVSIWIYIYLFDATFQRYNFCVFYYIFVFVFVIVFIYISFGLWIQPPLPLCICHTSLVLLLLFCSFGIFMVECVFVYVYCSVVLSHFGFILNRINWLDENRIWNMLPFILTWSYFRFVYLYD